MQFLPLVCSEKLVFKIIGVYLVNQPIVLKNFVFRAVAFMKEGFLDELYS